MAKIHIERAYIEPFGEENLDNFQILLHIKEGVEHTFVGKVELDRLIPWMHFNNAENGDLEINNSAGVEVSKWDHITREILGENIDG